MDFMKIKNAVATQFSGMKGHQLFRTAVEKDDLWNTYLASFPAGTDPIFRERTEHDCSCCRQFIRAVGNVVAIINGKVVSIWDCQVGDPNYQVVVDAMSALVKSKPIENIFLSVERTAGTDKNFEDHVNGVITWNHFFVNIPAGRNGEKNFVVAGKDIGTKLSDARASHDVLLRGLTELTDESVDTVLELIAQNSLYRGADYKGILVAFRKLKTEFNKLAHEDRDAYAWLKSVEVGPATARIRNTAIGTLLIDLSNDEDLEKAVKVFETSIMAPSNYKRPTALVTKNMIENAKKTVTDLGLISALDRRYATLTDININNILFADRKAKQSITGNIFDELAGKMSDKKPNMDRVEEVTIDKFLSDILPKAESLELFVENRHYGNLMSLIAPVDPTAGELFKWNNPFSWSYNGDVTDSVKERVKKAGGNVTGELCCRLAWYNFDDLDFHMKEPTGHAIYYGTRDRKSTCGGRLDVDMNAGRGVTREPVENIFYKRTREMKPGTYRLFVHNYSKRETVDVGFEVEIDLLGTVQRLVYDRAVSNGGVVEVAEIHVAKDGTIKIETKLPATSASKQVWGIATESFQKVDVVMLSPNFWEGNASGNKHYFFMINGCQNDGSARGFYNEFLKPELETHRKAFEMVGSKMRTSESDNQLSGLGFSSTQRNSVLCRVTGAFTRIVKITF